MKSKFILPLFITGPYLGDNSDDNTPTDRTKVISWFSKKNIILIFPDDLNNNRAKKFEGNYLIKSLEKKYDSFEYVLSKISMHHINLHITSSAIFELGQFHSFSSRGRTLVLTPSFFNNDKKTDNTYKNLAEKKYKVSAYIDSIYGKNIKKYFADVKIVEDENNKEISDIYPDAYWSGTNSITNHISKIYSKISNLKISLNVRKYNSENKNFYYSNVTYEKKSKTLRIPLVHTYVFFVNHILKNKPLFISAKMNNNINWINIEKFKNHILEIYKSALKVEDLKLKFLFSKSRTSWKTILITFMWIFMKSFNAKFFQKDTLFLEKLIFPLISKIYDKKEYWNLTLERKNKKNRVLTVYAKSFWGDLANESAKEKLLEMNSVKSLMSSSFSYAYEKKHNYPNHLSALQRHYENVKTKKYSFIKIDISDFFNSISKNKNIILNNHLKTIRCEEYNQGTVLAPKLSNIYMKKIDEKISKALPKEAIFTRYSDDILITFRNELQNDDLKSIYEKLETIISDANLEINKSKTIIGNQEIAFKYLGIIIYKGVYKLPNNKSKKIVQWVNNPKKYNLDKKWIKKYVENLTDSNIIFRSDKYILKKIMI